MIRCSLPLSLTVAAAYQIKMEIEGHDDGFSDKGNEVNRHCLWQVEPLQPLLCFPGDATGAQLPLEVLAKHDMIKQCEEGEEERKNKGGAERGTFKRE